MLIISITVSGKCGHNFHMVSNATIFGGKVSARANGLSTVLWSGLSKTRQRGNALCADKVSVPAWEAEGFC
jgi:hypothetical protein